ncbi:MAG: cation diffusion facilitator family transporter, partial [Flavobacteriales bacterium]
IEFFSSGLEGTLIGIAGIYIISKAIYQFIYPVDRQELNIGSYIVLAGGLVNFVMGMILERTGKKYRSITLEADGKHLKSDTLTSVGLFIGLWIVLLTEQYWIDSLIALILGLLLIRTGYKLIRESISGLMDEADLQILEDVITILEKNKKDKWIDVHNMRAQKYGHYIHIDCHMTFPWYETLQKTHDEIEKIEKLIQGKMNYEVDINIHADPCFPDLCSICTVQNCPERNNPFEKRVTWRIENVSERQRIIN